MSGALAARPTDKESGKGRVDATRVKRYWPGRAPAWIEAAAAAGESAGGSAAPTEDALAAAVQRTAITAPVVLKQAADPRLARLAQRQGDRQEAIEEHRKIRAAEVVRRAPQRGGSGASSSDGEDDSESEEEAEDEAQEDATQQEEDQEELQRRRDALRER
jgi:hypothetical protein